MFEDIVQECDSCGCCVEFVVGDVSVEEDLISDDEVIDAEFYLVCECAKLRVVFGNISIGGMEGELPEGWS